VAGDGVIVAGATSVEMAREARSGGADALLAFPTRDDPVAYHASLGEQLPVMAFDLYEAAGGVPYSDASLRALLGLPSVIGIKVATLDSVVRFQRIAEIMRDYPEKLLVTGEDRFLGYSMMMGATAALIGMGAVLTDLQARLIDAFRARDWPRAIDLTTRCDALGSVVFGAPVEGYIRRTLWALVVEGIIPENACDDPWGPPLPAEERVHVAHAVQAARLPPGVVS
jgi:4-hydroxy-tetrahydrodipicolinate synthase